MNFPTTLQHFYRPAGVLLVVQLLSAQGQTYYPYNELKITQSYYELGQDQMNRAASSEFAYSSQAEKDRDLRAIDSQLSQLKRDAHYSPQHLAAYKTALNGRNLVANTKVGPSGRTGRNSPAERARMDQEFAQEFARLTQEIQDHHRRVREQAAAQMMQDNAYYDQKRREGVATLKSTGQSGLDMLDRIDAEEAAAAKPQPSRRGPSQIERDEYLLSVIGNEVHNSLDQLGGETWKGPAALGSQIPGLIDPDIAAALKNPDQFQPLNPDAYSPPPTDPDAAEMNTWPERPAPDTETGGSDLSPSPEEPTSHGLEIAGSSQDHVAPFGSQSSLEDLTKGELTELHRETDKEFWGKYPEMKDQAIDPEENPSLAQEWLEIRNNKLSELSGDLSHITSEAKSLSSSRVAQTEHASGGLAQTAEPRWSNIEAKPGLSASQVALSPTNDKSSYPGSSLDNKSVTYPLTNSSGVDLPTSKFVSKSGIGPKVNNITAEYRKTTKGATGGMIGYSGYGLEALNNQDGSTTKSVLTPFLNTSLTKGTSNTKLTATAKKGIKIGDYTKIEIGMTGNLEQNRYIPGHIDSYDPMTGGELIGAKNWGIELDVSGKASAALGGVSISKKVSVPVIKASWKPLKNIYFSPGSSAQLAQNTWDLALSGNNPDEIHTAGNGYINMLRKRANSLAAASIDASPEEAARQEREGLEIYAKIREVSQQMKR